MIIFYCILYEVQMYLECQSQTQSPYLEYVLNCNYNFLLDVYMGWYVWVSRYECEYVLGIELRLLGLTGSDFACSVISPALEYICNHSKLTKKKVYITANTLFSYKIL